MRDSDTAKSSSSVSAVGGMVGDKLYVSGRAKSKREQQTKT